MEVGVWARHLGEHPGLSTEPQKAHIPVVKIMSYQQGPFLRSKSKIERDLHSQSLKYSLNTIKGMVLTWGILLPRGLEKAWIVPQRMCYWYLMGRGQGSC